MKESRGTRPGAQTAPSLLQEWVTEHTRSCLGRDWESQVCDTATPKTPAPEAHGGLGLQCRTVSGALGLSLKRKYEELNGETGELMKMTQSLGAGLQEQLPSCLREPSSLSPASVISCKHSVMEWEPQVPICPPRFIRTGAPGSSHSGGILGPKFDHQREEHLFVTLSSQNGQSQVTRNLPLEGLFSLHLCSLFAEQSLAPSVAKNSF